MIKNRPRRNKILIALSIVIGIAILIGGWLYIQPRIPHPLGDQLEYIGKRDYGCAGFWLCDSHPGTTYFYATDLTPPELATYFQKARATDPQFQIDRWQNRGESFHIDFINEGSTKRFTIYFYTNPSEQETSTGVVQPNKKYVVSLDSDYYKTVLNSL